MECWIERHHFMQARGCVELPPRKTGEPEPNSPPMLRIEAAGDKLTLRTKLGEATVAARLAHAGVLFVPVQKFLDLTEGIGEGKWVEVLASDGRVRVSGRGIGLLPGGFAYFDDPAAAPEWWEPPPAAPPAKVSAVSKDVGTRTDPVELARLYKAWPNLRALPERVAKYASAGRIILESNDDSADAVADDVARILGGHLIEIPASGIPIGEWRQRFVRLVDGSLPIGALVALGAERVCLLVRSLDRQRERMQGEIKALMETKGARFFFLIGTTHDARKVDISLRSFCHVVRKSGRPRTERSDERRSSSTTPKRQARKRREA